MIKLDLIETEVKHENLKCMGVIQDNLCHPYNNTKISEVAATLRGVSISEGDTS